MESKATGTNLAALALLDVQVGSLVLGVVGAVPVQLLDFLLAVAVLGEVGFAVVGEVALLIDTEVVGAGAIGSSAGMGHGQSDRLHGVRNNVEVLEAGGSGVLGGEGDHAVRARADCILLDVFSVVGYWLGDLRIRISWLLSRSPPT